MLLYTHSCFYYNRFFIPFVLVLQLFHPILVLAFSTGFVFPSRMNHGEGYRMLSNDRMLSNNPSTSAVPAMGMSLMCEGFIYDACSIMAITWLF